jgi:preprotein translocase subunit SecE
MGTKVEAEGGLPDAVKWALAIVLLAGGVAAFYLFADQSQLYRIIGMLVVAGIALAIASSTAKGRETIGFIRESRNEVRKVVWPTRKETLQTTAMVFVVVVIVAIMLWMLDTLLGWTVSKLLGWGS